MFDELENQNNNNQNQPKVEEQPAVLPAEEKAKVNAATSSGANETEQIHTMPMEYYLGKETVSATKTAAYNAPEKTPLNPEKKKKILNLVIVGGLVVLVGISGFLLLKSFDNQAVKNTNDSAPIVKNIPKVNTPKEEPKEEVKEPEKVVDSKEMELAKPSKSAFNPNEIKKFSLALMASNDEDRDGLTDNEEVLFGTNPKLIDSDGDVYKDKEEIKNFYSPVKAQKIRLWEEKFIAAYENKKYGYKIYYPSSWLVDALVDDDPSDVMISSSQNEFINIIVDQKRPIDSLQSWYLSKAPAVSAGEIKKYTTYNKLAVIESPDAFTVYLESVDKTKVFAINYNIGLKEEASFGSVFEMIFNSFQFIKIEEPEKTVEKEDIAKSAPAAEVIESEEAFGELPAVMID